MNYDARAVANSLIEKAGGNPLTPLQIIKLVYFCHGWMLGLYGRPLIKQEVRAWLYGPVVADVYHGLKDHGGVPVATKMNVPNEQFDEFAADLINQVHTKYGGLSGIVLSGLTHAPGTPWHTIWHRNGKNSVIPNDLIQEHYAEKSGQ